MTDTICIVGASGQLGQILISSYQGEAGIVGLSRDELDITDPDAVKQVLMDLSPSIVINCAAFTAVDLAETEIEAAYRVNETGINNIAQAISPESRLIHLSTDFVFSKFSTTPYSPASKIAPVSVYGSSKLAGENALIKLRPINSLVLRTSWLYSSSGHNFLTSMLKLMSTRDVLRVVNDQIGSPTSAYTLAEVIWQLTGTNFSEKVLHWSDEGVISWYDFACEIQEQAYNLGILSTKIEILPIGTVDYPTPASRPVYSALDSTKTEQILGRNTLPWKQQLAIVLSKVERK